MAKRGVSQVAQQRHQDSETSRGQKVDLRSKLVRVEVLAPAIGDVHILVLCSEVVTWHLA